MSRADELKSQIATLQAELDNLPPHEAMNNRELARASGVSPTTAARFKTGDTGEMQLSTLKKLMPFTRCCPLCGQASDPEAWGASSTVAPQAEGDLFEEQLQLTRRKFLSAQHEFGMHSIISELENGRKEGHWMHCVFPQLRLGTSEKSVAFSLTGVDHAAAYMDDGDLGLRLVAAANAVANNLERGETLEQIFGDELDAKKFRSSMTLFEEANRFAGGDRRNTFTRVLDLIGENSRCKQTLELIEGRAEE